jgi:hypothetical protein
MVCGAGEAAFRTPAWMTISNAEAQQDFLI